MIKKILPISIFVLVFILILLLGLQNMLKNSKSQGVATITPTLFQGKQGSGFVPQTNKTYDTSVKQLTSKELQERLPIIAPDFTLDYSPRLQKYVVNAPTDEATNSYNDWLDDNPDYQSELDPPNVIVAKQTMTELHNALDVANTNKMTPEKKAIKDAREFTSLLNIVVNLPQMFLQ